MSEWASRAPAPAGSRPRPFNLDRLPTAGVCGPARVLVPAAAFGGAAAIALVPFARAWPLLFGFLAGTIGDGSGEALRTAFLVMLVPLGAAGAILLYARRTYPADAAAAGGDGSRR